MPFGKPKAFDESKTDRASCNFSIDDPAFLAWAQALDTAIETAARASGLLTRNERYIPMVKPGRGEHPPTFSVKCQLEGLRSVRCWSADHTRMALDSFDWRAARVCPRIQLRGLWIQPGNQFGPACDVIDMLVWPGDGDG